jgi:plasmid segregation protein ParM
MTTPTIDRIGLDVGFGDVKAAKLADGKLSTVHFPAVIGQAQALSTFTVGLNSSARRRATRMVYEGVEYYIGADALEHSRTQAGRQDRQRIGSVEERVLALAALAKLGVSDAYIVTGLPVLWFEEHRNRLRQSLKGRHTFAWGKEQRTITIHKVKVVPQPLGGFFSYVLDKTGRAKLDDHELKRTFACLDIGWNTTDLSAIKELRPVDKWIGGARVGVRDVIQMVGDAISREHGLSLNPHEIDQAIETGQVEVYGRFHSIGPSVASTTTALAQQVVSTATDLWGNGERMSKILIFGGGAVRLGPAIHGAFPYNGVVLPHPALANAIGFCYFAQRGDVFAYLSDNNSATPIQD